ncbi:MAG: ATP-binding cassette domain-containing protein [Cyanobacteria bacterium P01_H01_bin.15]
MKLDPPILELHEASVWYRSQKALNSITVAITTGERVGLIGPSGAGKSSFLRLLNGSLAPSTGQVFAFGQNWQCLASVRRRRLQQQLGLVEQQHHLVSNLAVIHNVNAGNLGRWSLPKSIWSLLWPLERDQALAALTKVGIPEKLYARCDRLSGGEQQRVALARVLVQDPSVILADEPVASLDPARSQALMELLCELCESLGKTLVVSLHDLDYALQYCTRLIGLRQGNLQFDATPGLVTPRMIEQLYALSDSEPQTVI